MDKSFKSMLLLKHYKTVLKHNAHKNPPAVRCSFVLWAVESLTCLANRKLHLLRHDDLKQGRSEVDDLVGLKHTEQTQWDTTSRGQVLIFISN